MKTQTEQNILKERYTFVGDTIMKDGHSMFIEDVVKDLNKSYQLAQKETAELKEDIRFLLKIGENGEESEEDSERVHEIEGKVK